MAEFRAARELQGLGLSLVAIEEMRGAVGSVEQIEDLRSPSYVTLGASDTIPNARVLTGGTGVSLTDGGAGSTVAVTLVDTAVDAGSYGSAAKLVGITIDAQGRITAAEEHDLTSDNVTEGVNLFFTDARARATLSAGTGIAYDSGTGEIAVDSTVATLTAAQTLTNKTLTNPTVAGMKRGGIITPAALGATENDYNIPAGTGVVRLTAAGGGSTITGIANGVDGAEVVLINVGNSDSITLSHGNAGSSAANRLQLASATNTVIAALGSAILWYDGTLSRWRQLGRVS